ncbi:MAG: macro domain-containing protein [Alphaproteobacteria bacterium]|nr:macro domain-containing protein [Alphaproteobacteria bacterium]
MTQIGLRLRAITADITQLRVDALVNAANAMLAPGGGVDGAIRAAAGAELTRATALIGACPTPSAVITPGFKLAARYVIHTAAPVFTGSSEDDELLAACYRNALILAREQGLGSVAFPALGTGIYGWPAARAAQIAFGAVVSELRAHEMPQTVIFCCFHDADRVRYQQLIDGLV